MLGTYQYTRQWTHLDSQTELETEKEMGMVGLGGGLGLGLENHQWRCQYHPTSSRSRMLLAKSLWLAVSWIARATLAPRLGWIAVVHVGIQPIHLHCNVIPQTDDQDHAAVQGFPHCFHTALLCKGI